MKKIVVLMSYAVLALMVEAGVNTEASEAACEEAWRINCGASFDYTDPLGNWWVQDEEFIRLYRWGYTGQYSFPALPQNL
ncbi:MAG: hypothetical protein FJZ16_04675 [Candidatus Omnitrophica bacterium]|nr:hypothetical protein [Candidatus Omnitrophota bacterium]